MTLGPNEVNPVCLLRKIMTRLRGTNFCTTSAGFAPSFVQQPNGPKCIQIVQNTPKHEFRVQWGGSGVFIAKNSDATSWHKLLHHFGPFCTAFCKATKRSQMHPNSTIHTKTLESNGVDRLRCCEKFPRDFMARTFASVWPVLN